MTTGQLARYIVLTGGRKAPTNRKAPTMTINSVTFQGQTYTRNGKAFSHAVITTSAATSKPLVEWASSRELADKNLAGHLGRAEKVANGDKIGGVYSREYYAKFGESVLVEVDHPEIAPAVVAEPAGRSANRSDDEGQDDWDYQAPEGQPVDDTPEVVASAPVVEDQPAQDPAPASEPQTDAEKDAAKRAQWAKNKRASRARLAAKKKDATAA